MSSTPLISLFIISHRSALLWSLLLFRTGVIIHLYLSHFQVKLCRLFDSDPSSLLERQRATLHWGVDFIYILLVFHIYTFIRAFATIIGTRGVVRPIWSIHTCSDETLYFSLWFRNCLFHCVRKLRLFELCFSPGYWECWELSVNTFDILQHITFNNILSPQHPSISQYLTLTNIKLTTRNSNN